MNQHYMRRGVFISLLGGMFMLGFVSGSVSQRSAQAQVPREARPRRRAAGRRLGHT
jgi:hypothetical protein